MRKVKVSVIIPTFNEEKNMAMCLETLLGQSFKEMEIIVVDDGSTDKTVEIVNQYPVKVLTQAHKGPAIARNKGAKASKGEVLVFMDADMIFDKDFIKELTGPIFEGRYKGTFSKNEYIKNWDNIWARCCNYNQNRPSKRMIPLDYPDEGIDYRAIKRKEFLKVGGFDDVGYTDTWSLVKKIGYRPHSVEGAVYYHLNPDNLKEIFLQSKWIAKREYKLGFIGKLIALARVSVPVSIINGLIKSWKYKTWQFLIFKIVYDLGAFLGLLEMMFIKKLSK